MSRRSAKSMLRGAGVLEQHANGRWFVGESRLRERLPDVYDRVYEHYFLRPAETTANDRQRPETTGSDRK